MIRRDGKVNDRSVWSVQQELIVNATTAYVSSKPFTVEMQLIVLSIFLSLLWISKAQSPNTLQFVELWFRHGERTPTDFLYFPYDPKPPVLYTESEAGELTNRGIQQSYQRGEFIRKNYGTFLGPVYVPSQIHVYSGYDNRTVTSAEALLAGVYKPDPARKWSTTLDWQPVAVHTDPTIDWVSTGIDENCPSYMQTFYASKGYKSVMAPFDRSLIEFLQNNTGVAINTAIDFNHVLDALSTKIAMNDSRLPYPAWAESIRYAVPEFQAEFHRRMIDAQSDTAGRYHADLLLSFMEDHINRPLQRKNKAVFISGHDTNLMTLGRHLNITPIVNKLMPFSALLAVELHLRDGTYFVEMYVAETLQDQLKPAESLYCKNPCKLEDMQTLLRDIRLSRYDWTHTCNGYGLIPGFHTLLVAAVLILLGILLVSTVILACAAISYRKQIKELRDPERRRLLESGQQTQGYTR